MKRIIILLFIFKSFLASGQIVISPDAKSFIPSTSGQSASGFSLSGFNSTDILLCAIGLPQAPTGTTFYITTTTGLTASIGYSLTGNKTRLTFTGTQNNINNALASLKINTSAVAGNIQISVSATINPAGYYYLPTNGHFYKPVSGFSAVSGFSGTSSTGYNNLKAYCSQQSFKGQTGYLMTITSADEDNFIFNNVPGNNIIFALTDNETEGTWKIDAGPESGTIVRIGATNQSGRYNNWAGGEPNNYGSGEDYVVTKWNGSQWNDYGPEATPFPGAISGYVIEFGTWTNPDNQTFNEFYNNSVTHYNGETFRVQYGFNIKGFDETLFKVRSQSLTNNQWVPFSSTYYPLNTMGKVELTNYTDTSMIVSQTDYTALTTAGQVEWAIIDVYSTSFGGHRLYIDSREFDGTGVSPSSVNSIKLFDIYHGPITFVEDVGGWKIFRIIPNISTKITSSSYQSYLRLQNGWYGTKAEFTFENSKSIKPQSIQFEEPATFSSMLNSIITVTDVYLAFKEISNKGIFGDQVGLTLTNGIQFMNADVNNDGLVDERDTFKLLQHLMGIQTLGEGLSSYMKILPKTEYDLITLSNWSTKPNITKNSYDGIIIPSKTTMNIFNYNLFWKGDVNMSHSTDLAASTVATNSLRIMSLNTPTATPNQINSSIIGEIVDGKVVITISLDPLQQELVGTQFQLNYDNSILKFEDVKFTTKGNPNNFGRNMGNYINLGSIITDGSSLLDNTTTYKVTFSILNSTKDILGLTSISLTDAVNKMGIQLKIKIE